LIIISYDEYKQAYQTSIPKEVNDSVKDIISNVMLRGDTALAEYSEKFDKVTIREGQFKVEWAELRKAYNVIPEALRKALWNSMERIKKFQELQMPEDLTIETAPGVRVGVMFDPIESVGLYIPGGSASYPSTVLMTAIPAKVAKVSRCVLFTPPNRDGKVPDAILAAAYLAEVDEVYKVGGAQAVAAMAYGTQTIRKVEKIVGPGNIYVTAAKMAVCWDVAVDMPAGPSEILIYTEGFEKVEWLVADIMAQAEHDPRARAIVVTTDIELAERLKQNVERALVDSPRRDILQRSISKSSIIIVKDRENGAKVINDIAPEHLELVGKGADEILKLVRNAGAVFVGEFTPVPIGDYTAGTNHVLPTMGWAKRASPLSVRDFLRAREYVRCSREGLMEIANDAIIIATSEGLLNHAKSISERIKKEGE
jgi:histidinol dehydrogenase